jgi:hypothetical protein
MTMALHRTFALLALLLAGCSQGRLDVVGLAPNSLRQDMVAYWPCDDATATTLPDHSGYGNDGTVLGATPTPGHFGNALHFESGNSVVVGQHFSQSTPSWSVALWVRPGAWASSPPAGGVDTYVTLISTEISKTAGWEMDVWFPAGSRLVQQIWKYNFAYPNPVDAMPWHYEYAEASGVEAGLWTHVVAVVDDSAKQILFYENGVLSEANAVANLILPGSDALYLGTWSGGERYFVGDLDDIVIYGRALTAAEVASLYKQPAPSVPR